MTDATPTAGAPTGAPADESADAAPVGLCLSCNYPLHGLADPRCPECGRAFDPADRRTMNLGRPVGPVGRWMLRPVRRWVVVLGVAATLAVAYATRPPAGWVRPSFVDLRFYVRPSAWRDRVNLLTPADYLYTIGVCLWALVLVVWLTRTAARRWVAWRRRQPRASLRPQRRRQAVLVIAALFSLACVAFGWPYRVAQHWVARAERNATSPPVAPPSLTPFGRLMGAFAPPPPTPCPVLLDVARQRQVLATGLRRLGPVRRRVWVLKIVAEQCPAESLPLLLEAARTEADPSVRATEVRLIGLRRDPDAVGRVVPFLEDPAAEVRAAAADAVGLLVGQPFPVPVTDDGAFVGHDSSAVMKTDPPIALEPLLSAWVTPQTVAQAQPFPPRYTTPIWQRPPPEALAALRRIMVSGATAGEREAAARALLSWPDDYTLRVAEWGVWVNDGGSLTLLRSVLDDIPPFVHRTGDSVDSLAADRVNPVMMIVTTKPVIHLTAGRAMAVDLEVQFRRGRPWFAYPWPDDFNLDVQMMHVPNPAATNPSAPPLPSPSPLAKFDRAGGAALPPLADPREGYPWVGPSRRTWGSIYSGGGPAVFMGGGVVPMVPTSPQNVVTAVGLRWQSLIVSPERLGWMKPPEVGADAKYQWWAKLRDVPSGWVASRGEAERFLYYDGPTDSPSPVMATLTGNGLRVTSSALPAEWVQDRPTFKQGVSWYDAGRTSFSAMTQTTRPGPRRRLGFFVDVRAGRPTLQSVDVPVVGEATTPLAADRQVAGDAAVERFRRVLTDAGLTDAEAGGMMACWRDRLFAADGRRFLVVMSPADYDALFPIRLRPPPSEMVRVGVVLTEF